jgi:hypothetical protein
MNMGSGKHDSTEIFDFNKADDRSLRLQSIDEVSPEEKRLVRKLDSKIMLLASIPYLFAFE